MAGSGIRSGSCLWPSARGGGEGRKAFFSSTGIPSVAEDRRGPRRGWILFAVDRCHDSAAARSSNAPWTLAFRRACLEKFAAPGGTPVALIPFHRFAGCVQLPYRGYGWNIEWIVANWCLLYVATWKERLLDGYAYQERLNFMCKSSMCVKNNEWIVANCCASWELKESVYWMLCDQKILLKTCSKSAQGKSILILQLYFLFYFYIGIQNFQISFNY